MTGGILLVALLCVALGLALSFAPRRIVLPAAAVCVASALGTYAIGVDPAWRAPVVIACSVGTVGIALCVHLPRGLGPVPSMILAAIAGICSGAVASSAGPTTALLALPLVSVAFPGRWIVSRKLAIVLKVLSGWVVAIAILAAALPLITTPGYVPDHME